MPQEKAPAFQFYPKDFLTDEKVVLMSNTEVGIYVRLLCFCWLEGTLPLETDSLAHMARMPVKQFTRVWEHSIVRTCFRVAEDGRLHHKRLDAERDKQDQFKRRQSDNGKLGGRPKKATDNPDADLCETQNNPGLVETEPKKSSPSPSPSPSAISDLQPPVDPSARVITDEDLGDRARELLQHYAVWYEELRGSKLRLIRNTLEFQEACDLCALWADDRLEKLAKIVLTTDDGWISGTDRGFKIFARKATWADARLATWERQQVGV